MNNKKRAADSGMDQQPRNTSLHTEKIPQSGDTVKWNKLDLDIRYKTQVFSKKSTKIIKNKK